MTQRKGGSYKPPFYTHELSQMRRRGIGGIVTTPPTVSNSAKERLVPNLVMSASPDNGRCLFVCGRAISPAHPVKTSAPCGAFCFDVPLALRQTDAAGDNKSLVRGELTPHDRGFFL